jgi:hypothetical protein
MLDNPIYHHIVQSMVVVMTIEMVEVLMLRNLFQRHATNTDYLYAVNQGEIKISDIALEHNFNLGCILIECQGVDFRTIKPGQSGDPYPGGNIAWEGVPNRKLHPYELIFLKSKNEVWPGLLNLNYIESLTQQEMRLKNIEERKRASGPS